MLEPTLAALARVGGRVRLLKVTGGPGRGDWGRATLRTAFAQVIARCPHIVAMQMPAEAQLAVVLQPKLADGLRSLHLDCTAHLLASPGCMTPVLAARSLPQLRSIALQHYSDAASSVWALFSALSRTALERLDLLQCSVAAVDMDVKAMEFHVVPGRRRLAMASEASDGVAAIALIFWRARDIGLTGGPEVGFGASDVQPKPDGRRLAECRMLVIDHFSTCHVPVLAAGSSMTHLFVQLRAAPTDFALLNALMDRFDASKDHLSGPFPALKGFFIRLNSGFDPEREDDSSLLDDDVARLRSEMQALEATIQDELQRRIAVDNRHWSTRETIPDPHAIMSGLVQPGILTYVRDSS